jgi:hypothetical protein
MKPPEANAVWARLEIFPANHVVCKFAQIILGEVRTALRKSTVRFRASNKLYPEIGWE